MKLIKLHGKHAIGELEHTMVDDEDFEYLNQFKWSILKQKILYVVRREKGKTLIIYREIMKVNSSEIEVDHIDHNRLNNQKNNLRTCTHKQNLMNRKKKPGKSSKYLGVYLSSRKDKWIARIYTNFKPIHLGVFPLTELGEIEAAKAYDKKAKEIFGEFANPNFK